MVQSKAEQAEADCDHLIPENVNQRYYDVEIAKICDWLKANGKTMHVTRLGSVSIRDKSGDRGNASEQTVSN